MVFISYARAGAVIALCAIASSGCATRYGSMGFTGGVESTPLTANTEMVVARGNGFTDSSVVQQFVLLKSAQDCLASGFTKFAFTSAQDTSRASTVVLPGQTYSNSTVTGYGNAATVSTNSYTTPGSVIPIVKPGATVIVRFFRTGDPAGFDALDAAQIAANLGPRLQN